MPSIGEKPIILTGKAWEEQQKPLSFLMPTVYPTIVFWANLLLVVWLLSLFSGLLPVSLTLPVTRHFRNPDILQLSTLKLYHEKNFFRKIMLSFPPIRAPHAQERPVYFLVNEPNFIKALLIESSRNNTFRS